jgi:hypothetical protein
MDDETELDSPVIRPGWSVSDTGAHFDGRPIGVAPSCLKLLRALVEADHPLAR